MDFFLRSLSTACVVAVLALGSTVRAQAPALPPNRDAAGLPSLSPLVDSIKAAVVNVDVQARASNSADGEQEFWEHFFGGRRPMPRDRFHGRDRVRQGMGSGFIIDPKGLALTNNHVVEGAINIRVRLDDGRSFDAEVLGRDPATDVALIKFKGKVEKLPVVKLGDSDATRVGDWVLAIGNPFGLASSVSVGIVSAKARQINLGNYDDFIQTDAAINPGNSGGPLFNLKGEVIGINTAIVGRGSGIGFAVPANLAKALLPQLEKDGSVTRGWLGIGIQDLSPELAKGLGVPATEGALVTLVNEGSPAKKAGVLVDDVIVSIDNDKVVSGNGLTRIVAMKPPGSTAKVSLFRNGKPLEVKVQLGTRPDLEGVGRVRQGEQSGEEKQKLKVGLRFQNMERNMAQGMGLPMEGALISEVLPGSPAERAELQPGMLVVEAGKKPVRNADDLMKALSGTPSGSVLLLRIQMPGDRGKVLRALTLP